MTKEILITHPLINSHGAMPSSRLRSNSCVINSLSFFISCMWLCLTAIRWIEACRNCKSMLLCVSICLLCRLRCAVDCRPFGDSFGLWTLRRRACFFIVLSLRIEEGGHNQQCLCRPHIIISVATIILMQGSLSNSSSRQVFLACSNIAAFIAS